MPTPSNYDVKITLLDRDPAVPLHMMASSNVTRFFFAHNLRFEAEAKGMVSDFAQHRERFLADSTCKMIKILAKHAGIAPLAAITRPAASYDWDIAELAPSPPPSWSREQCLQAHTAARGMLRRLGQLKKDYVIVIVAIDGRDHPFAFPRPDSSCWWLEDLDNFDIVIWQEVSGAAHAAYRAVDDQSPVYDHEWFDVTNAVLRAEGWHLLRSDIRKLVNTAPVDREVSQGEAHKESARRAGADAIRHAKHRYGSVDKLFKGEYKLEGMKNYVCDCVSFAVPSKLAPLVTKAILCHQVDPDQE